MTSDVQSVTNPASSLVHGSQALTTTIVIPNGGKSLPQDTKPAVPASKQAPTELTVQIGLLNKYLNDSGRPAQFRASADDKSIEEINPATGKVVAEYSATEFAALARSVGISGAVLDSHA